MTRKKTKLSLYKKWRKKINTPNPSHKPTKILTPKTCSTRKRRMTPKSSTRKRSRLKSPYIQHQQRVDLPDFDENNEWERIDDETDDEFLLFKEMRSLLQSCGLWKTVSAFITLLVTGKYPLDNIAFLLFLDTVKFYSCETTTQMSYYPESKRFWKAGYRLFHAKFLYFMSGPKNMSQCAENVQRGNCNPQKANINFAVPNVNTIENFDIADMALPKKMQTGVIEHVLKSISESVPDKRFMLCADAKKVTCGVDKNGGDVDMFGYEDGETLAQKNLRLKNELEDFQKTLSSVHDEDVADKSFTVDKLTHCCLVISNRIREAREMKARQEFGLNKFKTLGGDKWRESKYVYAISALHASLHQLKEFIHTALRLVRDLCKTAAVLLNSLSAIPDEFVIDQSSQQSMLMLDSEFQAVVFETQYVKQRSPFWREIRKLAFVTGSSIHTAIGLRGTDVQNKYLHDLLQPENDETVQINSDETARMEYGTLNEGNGLDTLAGLVLPTYYPSCCYVEEGCYISQGVQRDVLLVVSPDGSIREAELCTDRRVHPGHVVAAVEVKCPFPKDNKVTLHYSLSHYYVCQCLAEMFVLKTMRLLYVCWTPESTSVLLVTFDPDLWNLILDYILEMYDNNLPKRPKDSGKKIKDIKEKISVFVKNNVTILVEVPSLTLSNSGKYQRVEDWPFLIPMEKLVPTRNKHNDDSSEQILQLVNRGTECIETTHNLHRRKATEVMVWVLTHVNRDSSSEMPCSIPVAYGLKDYKLTAAALRKATDHVIRKCHEIWTTDMYSIHRWAVDTADDQGLQRESTYYFAATKGNLE